MKKGGGPPGPTQCSKRVCAKMTLRHTLLSALGSGLGVWGDDPGEMGPANSLSFLPCRQKE